MKLMPNRLHLNGLELIYYIQKIYSVKDLFKLFSRINK